MADNPKGELIAALAAQHLNPEFRVDGSGPAHAPSFMAEVWCDGQRLGYGEGRSRREAERRAAQQALQEVMPGQPPTPGLTSEESATAPWPLHPAVLAEALAVADSRLPQGTPLSEVGRQGAALYRMVLRELGHAPAPAQQPQDGP
ncbi:hypothetical protein GCM10017783_15620 [Deinococcus piscis]|uniref:DRBM domain-containing protein n=1 Tax=Deinococcus piscis TaxID=394230 RepID=A0ABQ3K4Z3_9DEIO|nr:putative dsRNA-binding protein [Deinococcus piscis]GHG03935.1 hypothetical protein GCM10017783_15620 [Deinococcus piscis]